MNLKKYLGQKQRLVEKQLKKYFGKPTEPPILGRAINYSLLAPGKRLRPIIMMATAELFGLPEKYVLPAACAIEAIHVYSLIHDDLPAMDNDAIRRGLPTNHIVFGEGMAILAGDTLQAEAFRLIIAKSDRRRFTDRAVLNICNELALACGIKGMAAGQAIDLQSETKKIQLTALRRLHYLKTGMLLRAAVRIGAISAGVKGRDLAALTSYAEHLGVAFQIQDDLLDVLGNTKVIGSSLEEDSYC